ncbi:MAG: flagellar brake protein [Halanaerobiaceae bacterium]
MAVQLEVNEKVDLVVEDGPYQGKYLCKIAEINDKSIRVTAPFRHGQIVPLNLHRPVKIYYTGENAAYVFETRVINRQAKPIALLTLEKPSEKKRIQRREYFRLETSRKIEYRILPEDYNDGEADNNGKDGKDDKEDKDPLIETHIIDISGGGVKLLIDDEFPEEGLIEMYIDLPGIEDSCIIGKIVNFYELPDGKAAGIEFVGIDRHDQEQIISWMFDYQRELRQRGLL